VGVAQHPPVYPAARLERGAAADDAPGPPLHGLRGAFLAGGIAAVVLLGLYLGRQVTEHHEATHAAGLVRSVLDADLAQVPSLITEIDRYRRWADPLLREAEAQAEPRQRLRASLALLPVDPGQVDYLSDRLLEAPAQDVAVLRDALAPHADAVKERCWAVVAQPAASTEHQRLRAAAALAAYDPDSPRWDQAAAALVGHLVAENPVYLAHWLDGFRPVRGRLLPALAAVFRDRSTARTAERYVATNLLADYAADQSEVLADLLLEADDQQFARLYPKVQERNEQARPVLRAELNRQAPPGSWADRPLDPAWQQPGPALVQGLEAAHGLVAERFAFCQTLPLDEFLKAAEALRPCGYRPVRLRPYSAAPSGALVAPQKPASAPLGATTVAALWTRDGRDWQLVHGVSAAEVHRRRPGYQPVDVAGYLDAGQERYAAVWGPADKDDDVRLLAGLLGKQYADQDKQRLAAKLSPVTLQAFPGADGEPRYSAVWRRKAPRGDDFWHDDEATHADRALSEGLPVDVSLTFSRQYVRDNAPAVRR